MYELARSLLFRLDPELAHRLTLDLLGASHRLGLLKRCAPPPVEAPVRIMGLDFPNPVGLAAGFDKDGECIEALAALGFGFVEVGTVTPVAQQGNDAPRLFRLTAQQAVINRMGFNNGGVDALVSRLQKVQTRAIVGVNIGKNRTTPAAKAADDYLAALTAVYPWADYVTINISSPNTPGLRDLQFGESLKSLLSELDARRCELAEQHQTRVPLVVKLAPDVSDDTLRKVAATILASGFDGVIACNTTISREALQGSSDSHEPGGLSGRPLTDKACHTIAVLADSLAGRLPIIGVGGTLCAADCAAKIKAGASLVQLYTGLIFQGPRLINEVAEAAALELGQENQEACRQLRPF